LTDSAESPQDSRFMIFPRTVFITVVAFAFVSCMSAEKRARLDREDDQRDIEYARERGQRAAAEYNEFLVGYARGLGKSPNQLTAAEKAQAERVYSHGDR
jgi:hypothetical protein